MRRGGEGAAQPRFSPDGRHLAYLAERPAAGNGDTPQAQVWILPLARGKARQLTSAPHGVSGFSWSPDGDRIAYWGWQGPPRFLVGPPAGSEAPTARRITSGNWRMEETGHLDYRTHLNVMPVRRRAHAVAVTAGDFDVASPAWDADGRSLVFCTDRGPQRHLYPRPRVWRVPADGSAADEDGPQEVVALAGLVEAVSVSPDGRWLALTGTDVEGAPVVPAPHAGGRRGVELETQLPARR